MFSPLILTSDNSVIGITSVKIQTKSVMLYLDEYFLDRFEVPVMKSSIAAIAAGSHPDSFRTRKLSLLTSDAVLRYASSRETSNAAIVRR